MDISRLVDSSDPSSHQSSSGTSGPAEQSIPATVGSSSAPKGDGRSATQTTNFCTAQDSQISAQASPRQMATLERPVPAGHPPSLYNAEPSGGPTYGGPFASSHFLPVKRPPSEETQGLEPPPKKQSKWTNEENDRIIRLRSEGLKWEEVSRHHPGRIAISCRLHYQNFLERRPYWDDEKKNKLARLYERSVNKAHVVSSLHQISPSTFESIAFTGLTLIGAQISQRNVGKGRKGATHAMESGG